MKVNWRLSYSSARLADRLKRAITSTSDLARAIGCTRARISDIACGRSSSVTLEMSLEMERILGVDLLGPDREAIAQALEAKAAMVRSNLTHTNGEPDPA